MDSSCFNSRRWAGSDHAGTARESFQPGRQSRTMLAPAGCVTKVCVLERDSGGDGIHAHPRVTKGLALPFKLEQRAVDPDLQLGDRPRAPLLLVLDRLHAP